MNKAHIKNALAAISTGTFLQTAKDLLATLGYRSELTEDFSGTGTDFIETFPAFNPNTQTEQALRNNAESVHFIFQITDAEIDAQTQQPFEFLEENRIESFFFFAVELKEKTYSRSAYAEFTREINKRLIAPTVVLFRVANRLTIGFVGRRPHEHNPERDVLQQVTLIKDIRLEEPHRAHLDILSELSLTECLNWMDANNRQKNFDGLLSAWLAKLNTEALNKQFYGRLFSWFEWAVREAKFPTDELKTLSPEEHIIRLITRLLFIWFLKEKGLVPEWLFKDSEESGQVSLQNNELSEAPPLQTLSLIPTSTIESSLHAHLKNFEPDTSDYYQAILQNLFFATLNTPINARAFSTRANPTHRDSSKYRYADLLQQPDTFLQNLKHVPFVNGGLFDCLDTFEATGDGGVRIDCFSDNKTVRQKLHVPAKLFFHKTRGLFPLFAHYKFTVEENTPIEQEVALDPELLGKVFENLLAACNPETGATARKQTGSYYTPRAIVDYMVDETLVSVLSQKCEPSDGDAKPWEERLRHLFDYAQAFQGAHEQFDDKETSCLVRAISRLKILDPAVGSGAFPMGILHKLTLALRRLDPDNSHWERLQKEHAIERAESAFETKDDQTRRDALLEIDETFKRYRDSDFGRKLYLIQNSLFGVDIQPMACQIAKLRFFISLAIEQVPDEAVENFGIKPLPNLETRFLAANTLIGLNGERGLTSNAARELERQLRENRERHFHATTRQKKLACIAKDKTLRKALAAELKQVGLPDEDAENLAHWNPYDQNTKADWFDAGWMFGITKGFDVVIGNPPYIQITNLPIPMRKYLFQNYQACKMRTDIYIAFLEKSLSILQTKGIMCFILPSAFAKQKYGEKMRQLLIKNYAIREVVDASSYRIFENAVVYNIILLVGKEKSTIKTRVRLHTSNADFDTRGGKGFFIDQHVFAELKDSRLETNPQIFNSLKVKNKIWQSAARLDQICLVAYGARLNSASARKRKKHYISENPISGSKPFCEGKNIGRYTFSQAGWLNYSPNEHYNPMFPELFENEKLIFINVVKDQLRFAYDAEGFYNCNTVVNCVRLDLLSGAAHISARRATQYSNNKFTKQYDYKFLLGVLNSGVTNWYFRSFLSEGLHCYPNDAKELPIPKVSTQQQLPIIELANQILSAKYIDPDADVSDFEKEIDCLVYSLYNLSPEEVAIVEGSQD